MVRSKIAMSLLVGLALVGDPNAATAGATPAVAAVAGAAAADAAPTVNIEFERYTLDNGLEVILHQDRSAPQVAINVWYHVGSGNEVPGRSGFAHLFEHMMFQGAKHIGEDVHFDILREIGGTSVNGTTNSDRTNYFEIVPSHHIETGLWLESDRMGYLLDLLNEKSLENQQEVVRNERRQRYDNVPYGLDRFAVAAALYPEGHPYRYLTIGRHEDLEAAKLADVRAFFEQWYVPSNATLTLAGDFEIAQAKQLVDKWFGSFPKLAKPESKEVQPPPLTANVREEIQDPFARLVRVHYVWHGPKRFADGDLELDALSDVLGANGWGRLYKKLVVEEELAQRVMVYNWSKGFSGEFHVVADVKPGKSQEQVEGIIAGEISRALSEPISAAELQRVKNQVEANFVWSLEELMSRVERLQAFNHYAGDPGYTDTYLQRIRAITPAAIQTAAKTWLSKPRVEIITMPAPKGGSGPQKGPGEKAMGGKAKAAKQGSKQG
jgi:predicted Zn-dependent peptidase